jgi:hypothetical protein
LREGEMGRWRLLVGELEMGYEGMENWEEDHRLKNEIYKYRLKIMKRVYK